MEMVAKAMRQSKKYCVFSRTNDNLTFSLVDYRNNHFISDDPNKIIEFYNGFDTRDELIQWMKERPRGVANIHEVEGDKDIIVVIPTADLNGKYAKECRDNIFKGLHIIFVESGEVPDPYFNYAHNCNVGIRKAMEYNPKWVVLSNDDVNSDYKPKDLISELSKLDNGSLNMVFCTNGYQTATKTSVHKLNMLGLITFRFLSISGIYRVMNKKYRAHISAFILNRKFKNRYITFGDSKGVKNYLYRKIYSYVNFEAFGIFSGRYFNKDSGLFDETYINWHEDQDVSIILSREPNKIAWINYGIEGVGGGTLQNSLQRILGGLASESYLSYKIENGLIGNSVIPS